MAYFTQIPFQKVGTIFQNPAWRYEALKDPLRYRLKNFVCRRKAESGHLKRFLAKKIDLRYTVNFKYPPFLQELLRNLPHEQSLFLSDLWAKQHKKFGIKKVTCDNCTANGHEVTPWNLGYLHNLRDEFLLKAVSHFVGDKPYPELDYALGLLSPHSKEIKTSLGYSFYAGVPDIEIAKRWKISVKSAEAVRFLFFDFSHLPTDRIARWAMLRQFHLSGYLNEVEFVSYKRIYDMGELGIKMGPDYQNLQGEDKVRVTEYLGNSAVINVLNLNLTIDNAKEASNYARIIGNYAQLDIEREEVRTKQMQTQVQIRLLEAREKQMALETGERTIEVNAEDKVLMDHLLEMSLQDAKDIPHVSISDLK